MCVSRGTKPNPVAKEIGISSGIITKWKTIGTLPNGDTLIKIAEYLDCSVDYLLGLTDDPAPYKTTKKPAPESEDELNTELLKMLSRFTPEEAQRLADFAKGIEAARKV